MKRGFAAMCGHRQEAGIQDSGARLERTGGIGGTGALQ